MEIFFGSAIGDPRRSRNTNSRKTCFRVGSTSWKLIKNFTFKLLTAFATTLCTSILYKLQCTADQNELLNFNENLKSITQHIIILFTPSPGLYNLLSENSSIEMPLHIILICIFSVHVITINE